MMVPRSMRVTPLRGRMVCGERMCNGMEQRARESLGEQEAEQPTSCERCAIPFTAAGFVMIEARREVLKRVLKEYGLNVTQFRLLLLLVGYEDGFEQMQGLAAIARLPLNVVTQATNVLVERGLASKDSGTSDGRMKMVRATADGELTVETVHMALVYFLRLRFNPANDAKRGMLLTRGIYSGAHVGGLWSDEFIKRFPSATNLIAIDCVAREVEGMLREEIGLSYNEARLLQRLAEVGHPMRAKDLATQLALPPTTITRAAQRLESKGYLERLVSSSNAQAVFFWPSQGQGKTCQTHVLAVFNEAVRRLYWDRVDANHLEALRETTRGIENLFCVQMDELEREQFEINHELLATLSYS